MPLQKLEDHIVVIPNALSLDLCDEIIAEYKDSDSWEQGLVSGKNIDSTSVRKCETVFISMPSVIQKNPQKRQELDSRIFKSLENVITTYKTKFPLFEAIEDTGYELLKYNEGGFYVQHTDSFPEKPRVISCSVALNTDFEGGEFAFFDREITHRVTKGSAIVFPANFMFPHEILPVTSGTRYSMITWIR